jgi:hypothetical protein
MIDNPATVLLSTHQELRRRDRYVSFRAGG